MRRQATRRCGRRPLRVITHRGNRPSTKERPCRDDLNSLPVGASLAAIIGALRHCHASVNSGPKRTVLGAQKVSNALDSKGLAHCLPSCCLQAYRSGASEHSHLNSMA
jgi:hypothetical protein